VIAFFPVTDSQLEQDKDGLNESYSDFLFYALTAAKHYRNTPIDVEINTDAAFRVVTAQGEKVLPGRLAVGYCFVTPEGIVHMEDQLLVSDDIYAMVRKYLLRPRGKNH
jgi:hypothetical protein